MSTEIDVTDPAQGPPRHKPNCGCDRCQGRPLKRNGRSGAAQRAAKAEQQLIDEAPQELKLLGQRLADLLDADHWNNIEPMLLDVARRIPAASVTEDTLARVLDPAAGWDRRPSNSEHPDFERDDAMYDRRQAKAHETARMLLKAYEMRPRR